MPFFVYETIWSEGSVVAHTDDKLFALGCDHTTGNIIYVTHSELIQTESYRKMIEFDDPFYIKKFDTALYPRKQS